MATVPRDRKDIGLVTVLRPIMATPASGGHPRAVEGALGTDISTYDKRSVSFEMGHWESRCRRLKLLSRH